jgi:hypothetical protein
VKLTKHEWEMLAARRKHGFRKIAETLGESHSITRMMGSLAWGRSAADFGPDGGLQDVIRQASFMDGFFDCLNLWARDNDAEAQRVMLRFYSKSFARDAAEKSATSTNSGDCDDASR